MRFSENDVIFTYYNPNERANSWMLDPNTGVIAKHVPTGLEVRCGIHSNKNENRISAVYELKHKVSKAKAPSATDFSLDQFEADLAAGIIVSRQSIVRLAEYARRLERRLKLTDIK